MDFYSFALAVSLMSPTLLWFNPATDQLPHLYKRFGGPGLTFRVTIFACSSWHSCCRAQICLSFARSTLACSLRSVARWRASAFLQSPAQEPFTATGALTCIGERITKEERGRMSHCKDSCFDPALILRALLLTHAKPGGSQKPERLFYFSLPFDTHNFKNF